LKVLALLTLMPKPGLLTRLSGGHHLRPIFSRNLLKISKPNIEHAPLTVDQAAEGIAEVVYRSTSHRVVAAVAAAAMAVVAVRVVVGVVVAAAVVDRACTHARSTDLSKHSA
jgi:hypothetical protein